MFDRGPVSNIAPLKKIFFPYLLVTKMYLYLDPPFGCQSSAPGSVFGGSFGAQISYPKGGFRSTKSIRIYLFQAPRGAKALYQQEDFSQAEMTPVKEILVSIGADFRRFRR